MIDKDIKFLIGKKVRVLTVSADNFFRRIDTAESYTIKAVEVEITEDGLFRPVIILEEFDGYFLPKDLQLL